MQFHKRQCNKQNQSDWTVMGLAIFSSPQLIYQPVFYLSTEITRY
ncbi:hypothetical protein CEV31_1978 [Brucella thiophenivorans]|uniref:Uncharacterized protein n=1 Tax=Brucella thiophenivorans TaxID=571255 RepID=A0A256FXC1_9HYPH|nr:hypothetical protein CEV31_1978 [Brucella thiophenivorans]